MHAEAASPSHQLRGPSDGQASELPPGSPGLHTPLAHASCNSLLVKLSFTVGVLAGPISQMCVAKQGAPAKTELTSV